MNTSQTSDKLAAQAAKLQQLSLKVDKALRWGPSQIVDVTFASPAYADTEIRHTLQVNDPDSIVAIPLEWRFAAMPVESPFVYRDISRGRRAWGSSHIVLRCNVAGAQATLLLLARI